MANLTDSEENRLLDLSLPTVGGVWLALFTVAPGEAGGGTEVTGGAYTRMELPTGAAAGGSKSNSTERLFPAATADWGVILALAVMSAATAGTMRWYRALATAEQRTILTGDQYRVAVGAITFTAN
jgi:hypothetical protein